MAASGFVWLVLLAVPFVGLSLGLVLMPARDIVMCLFGAVGATAYAATMGSVHLMMDRKPRGAGALLAGFERLGGHVLVFGAALVLIAMLARMIGRA